MDWLVEVGFSRKMIAPGLEGIHQVTVVGLVVSNTNLKYIILCPCKLRHTPGDVPDRCSTLVEENCKTRNFIAIAHLGNFGSTGMPINDQINFFNQIDRRGKSSLGDNSSAESPHPAHFTSPIMLS